MAGTEGFEPSCGGVKVRCLTAWRCPSEEGFSPRVLEVVFLNEAVSVSVAFESLSCILADCVLRDVEAFSVTAVALGDNACRVGIFELAFFDADANHGGVVNDRSS